ncbi:MAG TPA: AAA family ATPase, partial [Gemmatimonadales bacterium]|nr:AAA family ATPase [Gemmatimonadales bacterium]
MAPPYTLRCLGAVELRSPGGDLVRFRTRKHLALLIYLAVEPHHPHRRDRLADLLWPHASAAEARHSVATALSVLRGKLGPNAFEAGRDQVRFVFPDLELDLDRLARGEVLGDEYTPPLEVGGFLDGLEILGAPDFMLWREQQRARWLPAIRDAAIRLMDHFRRTGNTRRIEVVADRLLALDDLSEDAVRAKMEARALAGDRVGALRIFEEWRLRLAEELGAHPIPLLENMANRLRRRGWEGGYPPALPVSQTEQWRNQIFVGRAAEYRMLYESWERTLKSEPRHALVLGDSGIGKTTLVERLVTAASLEGAVSVRAHCYEVERQIPYTAVGALVRGLLDRPGAAATAPEHLAELGRIVPEIRQRFAHLPEPRESQGETARLLLTEAVHQLATAVAEECPLILVVDDVHLADDVSVAVLHLIMRRVAEQRIMVVLIAREAELAQAPHTARLLENRQALGLEALELPPMTEEESAELVHHWARDLSPALPPPVRRALVVAAAGNPMVLELLFRDWQANGADCLALGVSAMTVDPGPRSHEDTYRALLERVFRDLGPEARAVLNLGSILGSRMNDL